MKSPAPFEGPAPFQVPKVSNPPSQSRDDDSVSLASESSRLTTASRESRLPKCTTRKGVSPFVGGCNYGNGGETNLRVVARIRPVSEQTKNSDGSRVVFAENNENYFSSPSKPNEKNKRESFGSVANLTARFNSPNNKALMPCTDAYTTATAPADLFSPPNNTSKTPLHKNNKKIVPVRQSFIQSPSSTKEIEEIIGKRAADKSKFSQSLVVGAEKFEFDAVSCKTSKMPFKVCDIHVVTNRIHSIFTGY